eukprot:CAMPEP_0178629490 /NCGR_PEP_ID=MMETSP0698-20121128/9975_1 /TAXON_ID=265572 /ORGANISM="Extubocellulus spinifer, Strain CCMP396" /LENGTH=177 /DNA_ID=CAMNT_0020268795 /DNA_START=567 /DNA_END=1100 /DNA_ORIENTATION=+
MALMSNPQVFTELTVLPSVTFPVARRHIAYATGGLTELDIHPRLCLGTRRDSEFVRERGRFGFSNKSRSIIASVLVLLALMFAHTMNLASSEERNSAPPSSSPCATEAEKSAVDIQGYEPLSLLPTTWIVLVDEGLSVSNALVRVSSTRESVPLSQCFKPKKRNTELTCLPSPLDGS